ncbi:MAG: ArsR family transcriptional regulator [Actinomycetia bacterium]|nr:ArsR family transcriptional regulator [Actinomycetes bacterium]
MPARSSHSRSSWTALVWLGTVLAVIAVSGCGVGGGAAPSRAQATRVSPPAVSVFPIPGSRVATPQTQIAFRGVSPAGLGPVTVVGSRTGTHRGRVEGDSDGNGASFLPAQPFRPGERVTVSTGLQVQGGASGTFSFHVGTPAGAIPAQAAPQASRLPGDVLTFRSRPDLQPPSVELTRVSSATAPGDIFLTPQQGPLQSGPMILRPDGALVWFKPLPQGRVASDLRVQSYRGQPVLTWWEGHVGAGVGMGEDVIYDSAYRQLAVVRAANGLSADLHEFELIGQGAALITAYHPMYWNVPSKGGSQRTIVLDSVVQEIDIATGLVLFQWDSLDHVPVSDSHEPAPAPGQPFDYFHINSIQLERSGDLVVSARNTWAAYKLDRATGRVLWVLGGRRSSFKLSAGAAFAFQHDVRVRSEGDGTVTVFDDGAGPPTVHSVSRAMTLSLDPGRGTAAVVAEYRHSPSLLATYEGNVQLLPGGDRFLGWGQQPYFSEFDPGGQMIFDGRFVGGNSSYRAYRFPWTGAPATVPRVAATKGSATTTVDVSWNGATKVSSWRVLVGSSASDLRAVTAAPVSGFETQIDNVPADRYVAVRALDANGRVLGTSATVSPR